MAIGMTPCRAAPAQQPTECELKAAILYNLAKFVEWPESTFSSPDAPLGIGVLGEDPFGAALPEAVRDRLVAGHPIEIRRFAQPDAVRGCQVLFIALPRGEIPRVLRELAPHGVLTVGEGERFARAGGVIALVMEENRVAFAINLSAAERANLTLSSKLLRLARRVERWPVAAGNS